MQVRAIVGESNIEKRFYVKFGSNESLGYYDDFECAYLAACAYVNWEIGRITVKIFPQEVKDVMKKVTHNLVQLKIKKAQEKEHEEYIRLKRKFEGVPE